MDKEKVKSFLTAVGTMAKVAGVDVFVSARSGKHHESTIFSETIEDVKIGIKTHFPDDIKERAEMIEKLKSFADELAFFGVSFINTSQAYESISTEQEDGKQYRNPN